MTTLLSEREAAEVIGGRPSGLAKWRQRKKGPRYLKIVGRIRYDIADLQAFLDASRVDPSEQPRNGRRGRARR